MNTGEAFWKAVATTVVWGAVVAISIVTNGVFGASPVPSIVGLIMATVVTSRMWHVGERRPLIQVDSSRERAAEKLKRGGYGGGSTDKLALLMELMDDDEREAFKDTLRRRVLEEAGWGRQDGELPYDANSLEDLLDDDGKHFRR